MNIQAFKPLSMLVIGVAILATLGCGICGPGVLPTGTAAAPEGTPGPAGPTQPISEPSTDRQTRQNLLRATVQIIALEESSGRLEPVWTGSGSILTPSGLILTNAHIASDPDPNYQPDVLGIAVTVRSDQLPELRYLAEIRAVDHQLDLAVLQIVSDLDGRPINADQLSLGYVALGDSNTLELGDEIQILGYPGIGGETITFTEGVVSGFTQERGVEGRAFIKTDATIAGGNSGGLAANESGQIVGVPTQVGYGGAERFADCRYLADTNGDGVINQNDNCIPVGGFINALRPINLARPLIEAARAGIVPRPEPGSAPQPGGEARFYNILFAPDVTDDDQPTQIMVQMPSGTTNIYAFWDYEGMADGMTWEARWYRGDEFLETPSLPPSPWQGGERGNWWTAILNTSGLQDDTYRLELYVEGELLAEGSIAVGGTVTGPTITNLVFSDGVTSDDQPTQVTRLLPAGITTVYAFFDYEDMRDGMGWSRTWYYEGKEILTGSDTWDWGTGGSAWISLSANEPLDPGNYRLELSVEETLIAASDFTVAGTQEEGPFGPITFASGIDAQGNPVNPGRVFPTGLTTLHFFSSYAGMQNGMNIEEKWILDSQDLVTFDVVWNSGARGTYHDSIFHSSGDPLPDGEYELELYIEGQLVQQGTAVIGTGTPAPGPSPPPDGLTILGTIRDADTGQAIPGAAYIVFVPGTTYDTWDGSDAQVYAWADADASGYFELPIPLERNQRYSVVVRAKGYLPVSGDNLLVSDQPSPLEVEITLQRE